MSEEKTYCGFIAIVGRPNVGKSTLLNNLLGQKISITSRKAQTTRHRIVGIHTEGAYQAIYVDTPGLHMEEKRAINRLMNKAASSSIGDVELVIFVVEGTRWTPDDEMVLNKLRDGKTPVILAVNKVDNVQEKADLLPHLQWLGSQMNFLGKNSISYSEVFEITFHSSEQHRAIQKQTDIDSQHQTQSLLGKRPNIFHANNPGGRGIKTRRISVRKLTE